MGDNKVSEKAIWEGSIPSEDENTQFSQFPQSQPQMMFCYKCNNVIPNNSNYCPYCQVKLFTECPKCGAKYSSQYPACSQCGTNRIEFLQAQQREQKRIEARKLEERLQQERIKQEKIEKERQEALERQRRNDYFKKEREKYERKKAQIMNTEEYQSTYSILREALKVYRRKYMMIIVLLIASFVFGIIFLNDLGIMNERGGIAIAIGLLVPLSSFGLVFGIALSVMRLGDVEKREQYIWQYIGKKDYDYDKDILEYVVKKFRNFALSIYDILEHLSEWCIEAYDKNNVRHSK